jgi:ferritin-like metal-binding protein YciE
MAEACNERPVAEVCRQNLREEEAMAQFLDSNIEQVTRTYLAKSSSGHESQSGVM